MYRPEPKSLVLDHLFGFQTQILCPTLKSEIRTNGPNQMIIDCPKSELVGISAFHCIVNRLVHSCALDIACARNIFLLPEQSCNRKLVFFQNLKIGELNRSLAMKNEMLTELQTKLEMALSTGNADVSQVTKSMIRKSPDFRSF